MKEIQRFKK